MQLHECKTKNDKPVFSLLEHEGVKWLTSKRFEEMTGFRLAIATRFGGVSSGIYESLNFSVSQGDDPDLVKENFVRFGHATGIQAENMVVSQQTHTTHLRCCTKEDRGKGAVRHRGYTDVDGLYTDEPRLGLTISFADCVPVFFADPKKKVIAAVHSGWRGTVGKIGSKMALLMQEQYGCSPDDIYALIGPSICQDCYEVDEPVAARFREVYKEEQWPLLLVQSEKQKETGHYQLDLWEANRINLVDAGVSNDHIIMTNLCTCCNPNLIFSHRATKGRRGVTVGTIWMP